MNVNIKQLCIPQWQTRQWSKFQTRCQCTLDRTWTLGLFCGISALRLGSPSPSSNSVILVLSWSFFCNLYTYNCFNGDFLWSIKVTKNSVIRQVYSTKVLTSCYRKDLVSNSSVQHGSWIIWSLTWLKVQSVWFPFFGGNFGSVYSLCTESANKDI